MSVTPRGPDRRLTDLTIVLPASPPPCSLARGKRFANELLDGHVVLKASRSCNSLFPTEDMSSWGQLFSRGGPADASSRATSLGVDLNAACAPLLYVFDFDQTILRIHSYGSRIRAEVRPIRTAGTLWLSRAIRPRCERPCGTRWRASRPKRPVTPPIRAWSIRHRPPPRIPFALFSVVAS